MSGSSVRARLLWSTLYVLTKERYDALLQVFPSLDDAACHIDAQLLRNLGCREKTVERALQTLDTLDADSEERLLNERNARILSLEDPEYPSLLKDIADPPPFLYVLGNLSSLEHPCVAIVGTRRMTGYGARICREVTAGLVRAGVTTVSGLARGIDQLVAEETLKRGGQTVAVLGQGLATLEGRPKDVSESILKHGGLLLTEFPLNSAPDLFTFPLRNRIIAGLSRCTVVIEAPEGSGALITARLAFNYGREVFAMPGQIFDPTFRGCHALITHQQAGLVTSAADILRAIGMVAPETPELPAFTPQDATQAKLWNLLTSQPQHLDDLAEKSGTAAHTLSAALMVMELEGAVRNLGEGMWVRA